VNIARKFNVLAFAILDFAGLSDLPCAKLLPCPASDLRHQSALAPSRGEASRLRLQREGKRVRLWTRNGYNWSGRFPLITEAARRIKADHFVIGAKRLLGIDGTLTSPLTPKGDTAAKLG
jgi:hypothetical protein